MNKEFKKAENLIKETIEELTRIVDQLDGEDLSCYNDTILDDFFLQLAEAKKSMAIGQLLDEN